MENKFKPIPFWSWNEKLEKDKLIEQIDWMHEAGIGGFFMHARGGLKTKYLSKEWFEMINICVEHATKLGMKAYAYDENGWPSGFGNGTLLKDKDNHARYFEYSFGKYDDNAVVSYVNMEDGNYLNIFIKEDEGMVDVLNDEVVKKFINYSYKAYKKNDLNNNLSGFFTDEPQYSPEKYPYSSKLASYFKEQYGEDLFDNLDLLFVKKDGYEKFRYAYWKCVNDLFVSSYGKQIYDWCDKNKYKLTGHYTEESALWLQMGCCAGIMPLYKYMHIPGSDFLGRITERTGKSSRQIASVAAQYEKEQTISEMFALSGWDTTPEELKNLAEYHLVSGTSLICHHLVPYMEYGQRKRDFPIHFTRSNSWTNENFKEFNDFLSFIGEKLTNSKEIVDVGVLYPIRSCYFDYDPKNHVDCVKPLDDALNETCIKLNDNHIQYHFLDEKLLEEDGFVEGDKIGIGKCKYSYLVLPRIYTISKENEKLIREFVQNGGKVLLMYEKPSYVEGEKFKFEYLKSNTTIEEIVRHQDFFMEYNSNLRVSYREDNNSHEKFFYIVNLSDKTETILNGKKLYFDRFESKLLKESELFNETQLEKQIVKLDKTFKVSKPVDNYLTIDKLSFSKDCDNYSDKMYHIGAQNILLNERYDGDIYLKYNFNSKIAPNKLSLLIERCEILEVKVNNNAVTNIKEIYEGNLFKLDIQKYCKKGNNEIVIKTRFFESNNVYKILFGKNISSCIRNTLAYDCTIEPIYLVGDFGVFGDFEIGKEPDCYLGNNFYLDEPKNEVTNLILDGYPFLRGSIELEQDINIVNQNSLLLIDRRFSLIEIKINGKFVKKIMFDHKLDISNFVNVGLNKLELKLYISNRNLLGPHHVKKAEEEKACEISSFEMNGTWKNSKSSDFRENYSFVKTII